MNFTLYSPDENTSMFPSLPFSSVSVLSVSFSVDSSVSSFSSFWGSSVDLHAKRAERIIKTASMSEISFNVFFIYNTSFLTFQIFPEFISVSYGLVGNRERDVLSL